MEENDSSEIRLFIFLIFSVGFGLPELIWALRFLHLHRKIRGRISPFILLLLLSDLIQLFLNIYTLIQIFTGSIYWYPERTWCWFVSNVCGFLLHQLVALEGILTLKYTQFSARIFSLPCYIITCAVVIGVFLPTVLSVLKHSDINKSVFLFTVGTTLAPLNLLVVSFIITFKASPSPAIRNTHLLFTVAMVTFVMVYLPLILVSCVTFFIRVVPISWFNMSACLMSLKVISDPLLCVLVCRENLRDVQTPETHTEPDQMTG